VIDEGGPRLRFEALGAQHDRTQFTCGVEALDRYFRAQAGQDMRRRVATSFVLVREDAPRRPLGFYTLAATSVALAALPEATAKKLPRYPVVPATLMGRLAVDREHRGSGFGEMLLIDALRRALASEIASFAFIVDPKDDAAARFYARYRFRALATEGSRMFLPIAEVASLFE
jgi:ribosomal protein S18 acetylase RimI-like enzyme